MLAGASTGGTHVFHFFTHFAYTETSIEKVVKEKQEALGKNRKIILIEKSNKVIS